MIAKGAPAKGAAPRKSPYNARWQKARATWLRGHTLCAECQRLGRVTAATVVDHVVPWRGGTAEFWDTSNWQPLCKRCHDRKTSTRDGGFGRAGVVKGCDANGVPLDPKHPWRDGNT